MSLALRDSTFHHDAAQLSREKPVSAGEQILEDGEIIEHDDGLLAVAGPIILLCYGLLFTIAVFTFMGSGQALFAVLVSAGFALLYFTIPLLMMRIRAARDTRWHNDADHAHSADVDVLTGPMRRWEAIVQIVSIPIVIVSGFAVLAIRWSLQ